MSCCKKKSYSFLKAFILGVSLSAVCLGGMHLISRTYAKEISECHVQKVVMMYQCIETMNKIQQECNK